MRTVIYRFQNGETTTNFALAEEKKAALGDYKIILENIIAPAAVPKKRLEMWKAAGLI